MWCDKTKEMFFASDVTKQKRCSHHWKSIGFDNAGNWRDEASTDCICKREVCGSWRCSLPLVALKTKWQLCLHLHLYRLCSTSCGSTCLYKVLLNYSPVVTSIYLSLNCPPLFHYLIWNPLRTSQVLNR